MRALSISKFEDNIINEDAACATDRMIAVSDGAGGGGVYAECWSRYLVSHLPQDPINSYDEFDKWIDSIWEPFYNESEQKAEEVGGMFLNKFYDEGSFATLIAVWKDGTWIGYGDSVAFCYDKKSGVLQHSFTRLADFNRPPYLINCKDPLHEQGFRRGSFSLCEDSVVFAASDTLAHYILMMYYISRGSEYSAELLEAMSAQTKNSNFIKTAMNVTSFDFGNDIIGKLMNCKNTPAITKHLQKLVNKGLLGHDDYSLAVM